MRSILLKLRPVLEIFMDEKKNESYYQNESSSDRTLKSAAPLFNHMFTTIENLVEGENLDLPMKIALTQCHKAFAKY